MDEKHDGEYIEIIDEEGQTCTLEIMGDMEYNGQDYYLFLPADLEEDDPDFGFIILKGMYNEANELEFEPIESDEEEQDVYEKFMALLFEEEEE